VQVYQLRPSGLPAVSRGHSRPRQTRFPTDQDARCHARPKLVAAYTALHKIAGPTMLDPSAAINKKTPHNDAAFSLKCPDGNNGVRTLVGYPVPFIQSQSNRFTGRGADAGCVRKCHWEFSAKTRRTCSPGQYTWSGQNTDDPSATDDPNV
jgi:hypothetical protein